MYYGNNNPLLRYTDSILFEKSKEYYLLNSKKWDMIKANI